MGVGWVLEEVSGWVDGIRQMFWYQDSIFVMLAARVIMDVGSWVQVQLRMLEMRLTMPLFVARTVSNGVDGLEERSWSVRRISKVVAEQVQEGGVVASGVGIWLGIEGVSVSGGRTLCNEVKSSAKTEGGCDAQWGGCTSLVEGWVEVEGVGKLEVRLESSGKPARSFSLLLKVCCQAKVISWPMSMSMAARASEVVPAGSKFQSKSWAFVDTLLGEFEVRSPTEAESWLWENASSSCPSDGRRLGFPTL